MTDSWHWRRSSRARSLQETQLADLGRLLISACYGSDVITRAGAPACSCSCCSRFTLHCDVILTEGCSGGGGRVRTFISYGLYRILFKKIHLWSYIAQMTIHSNDHTVHLNDLTTTRSPYSITERRVPELIPVLGSQPAGDVSHKPGGRLPLLSTRPAVTPTILKRAATNFAAWWTESRLRFEPRPFCA